MVSCENSILRVNKRVKVNNEKKKELLKRIYCLIKGKKHDVNQKYIRDGIK